MRYLEARQHKVSSHNMRTLRMKVAAMEIEAGFTDALKPSNIKKFFMEWLINPTIRLPRAVREAFKAPFKEMMSTFLRLMGPSLAVELKRVALVDFTDKFKEGFLNRVAEVKSGVKYQPHRQKKIVTTKIIPKASYTTSQNEVFITGYETAEDIYQATGEVSYDSHANKIAVESALEAWEATSYTATFFKSLGSTLFDFFPVLGALKMFLEEVHHKGWLKAIPAAIAFLVGDVVIPFLGLRYLSKAAFAVLANLPITEIAMKYVQSWSGKAFSEVEGGSGMNALELYESQYGRV